jgi:plasmid maintenance system antidote protein VapI
MTDMERLRVGRAVEQRIADLSLTFREVSRIAGIDPKTLRALITGARWPTAGVRTRVESALAWPPGELLRLAGQNYGCQSPLADYSSVELLAELLARAAEGARKPAAPVADIRPLQTNGQEH